MNCEICGAKDIPFGVVLSVQAYTRGEKVHQLNRLQPGPIICSACFPKRDNKTRAKVRTGLERALRLLQKKDISSYLQELSLRPMLTDKEVRAIPELGRPDSDPATGVAMHYPDANDVAVVPPWNEK